MPMSPPHPCNAPGCPSLTTERFCPSHKERHRACVNAERPNFRERGYSTRWTNASRAFLRRPENALCAECARHNRVTPAGCVDHVIPIASGKTPEEQERLRWDESNWQPLCDWRSPFNCHGKKTAKEDGAWGRPRLAR